jgi:DNA-binding GntR family transcriptional regulator
LREIIVRGQRAARGGVTNDLIELDLLFHGELYRACGNQVVVDVMQTQWAHIRRVMETALSIRSYGKRVWTEHKAILEAVVRRDVLQAESLAIAHTQRARLMVAEQLQTELAHQQGER